MPTLSGARREKRRHCSRRIVSCKYAPMYALDMADRTGIAQIDEIVEQFKLDHPDCNQIGQCHEVSLQLIERFKAAGLDAFVTAEHHPKSPFAAPAYGKFPAHIGYDPDASELYDTHYIAFVCHGENLFSVDLTAAQFKRAEWPLVQRLETPGAYEKYTNDFGNEDMRATAPAWAQDWPQLHSIQRTYLDGALIVHAPDDSELHQAAALVSQLVRVDEQTLQDWSDVFPVRLELRQRSGAFLHGLSGRFGMERSSDKPISDLIAAVAEDSNHQLLVAVHEIGHMLDDFLLAASSVKSIWNQSLAESAWWNDHLDRLMDDEAYAQRVGYHARAQEAFATQFEQWVAARTADHELAQQINELRERESVHAYAPDEHLQQVCDWIDRSCEHALKPQRPELPALDAPASTPSNPPLAPSRTSHE